MTLLLFGFIRGWLYKFRAAKWNLSDDPGICIPFLGAFAQVMELVYLSNWAGLRWRNNLWSTIGSDLLNNCGWSMLIVYYHHKRSHFQETCNLRRVRTWIWGLLHFLPWILGPTFSALRGTSATHQSLFFGLVCIYWIPPGTILLADMCVLVKRLKEHPEYSLIQRNLKVICVITVLILSFFYNVWGIIAVAHDFRRHK